MVLAFGTRTVGPPAKEAVAGLAGIVACSPLVLQTFPAPKALQFIGGKASTVSPSLPIDAPIAVDVSGSLYVRVRADHVSTFVRSMSDTPVSDVGSLARQGLQ